MTDPGPDGPADRPRGTIPTDLGRQLRDAGLVWQPADGDLFAVPDRNLDDQVFMVSGMVIEVRNTPAGPVMAFNGTTEWALDAILQHEVIWLPREDQMRDQLGGSFRTLQAVQGRMRCVVQLEGQPVGHDAPTAAEAYGRALLHLLLHG